MKGSTLESFYFGVKNDYVQTAENGISGCLASCNEQGSSFSGKRL